MYWTLFFVLLAAFVGLDVALRLFWPFMTTGHHAGKLRAVCYILLLALLMGSLQETTDETLTARVYPDGVAGFFARYITWCQNLTDVAVALGIAATAVLLTGAVSFTVAYVLYRRGKLHLLHIAYIQSLWFSTLSAAVTCFCYPVVSYVVWAGLYLLRPLFFGKAENFCRKALLTPKKERPRKRRRYRSAPTATIVLPPQLPFRDIPGHYRKTLTAFDKKARIKHPFRQLAAPYSVALCGIALWTVCWVYSVSRGAYGGSETLYTVQAVAGISAAMISYEAALYHLTDS